jgi:hypothetical protein
VSAFDLIKVGTSRDPERRARAIFGQLLSKVEVPADKAADAEAYAHSLLAAHEESSEWFKCDAETAIQAVAETSARVKADLPLDTPDRPWLANSKRGLIKASQRRADRTQEALKIALTMWFDPQLTVKEISKRCGLSRHTLYDNLPPRFAGRKD